MPALSITAAPHAATYAVTLTHKPGAAMATALDQLDAQLAQLEAEDDAAIADANKYLAAVSARRDRIRVLRTNLKRWIVDNATELVNEAVEKIKAEEAEADALTTENAALKTENADLKARAVDQPTLDALNTLLHPADTTGGTGGTDTLAGGGNP